MYKIKRIDGKVPSVLKSVYNSYDEARVAIRKWVLTQIAKGKKERHDADRKNRTVTIGLYGFSIAKNSVG